jgi:molybdopterin synthase sulfur carrier subunit
MKVNVRYFASMRDKVGRSEESVSFDSGNVTVADLWKKVSPGFALPGNVLIAVNMEYTDPDHALKEGDEVAFFPPVTGG